MLWFKSGLKSGPDTRELLHSTSLNLIFAVAGICVVWHFIATLGWPQVFSPDLWPVTLLVLAISGLAYRALKSYYLLAQAIWLGGLVGAVFLAYSLFGWPEITLILIFLPLASIVTVGPFGALILILVVLVLLIAIPGTAWMPAVPSGYRVAFALGSLFTGVFGWSLSENLLSAISAASYHYQDARRLLLETRKHRAEISRMLKDQHQANYQLERLNEMLLAARRQAEEARDDRDRFILAVSHELRSPLNFILGFSDLMVNAPDTYAPIEEWPAGLYGDVQEIFRSSTHLLGLINDVLAMGQIDARQMTILREEYSMEALAEEVIAMVRPTFEKKGLFLMLESEPDLPPVLVDAVRIRQVMLNLLNNSLRFTDHGGVKVSLASSGEFMQVCVEDTGAGISTQEADKVFEEFRQVGQDNWRRREGAGLGLAISRRFILVHGGRMWLESQEGVGSRFYFTVPFVEAREASREAGLEEWAVHDRDLDRLVEPDHRQTKPVAMMLSRDPGDMRRLEQSLNGARLVQADQDKALAPQIARLLPRALLVDRIQGEKDDFASRLPYDLPVIRFDIPGRNSRPESLPPGVVDYLVKPATRRNLVEAVQRARIAPRHILVVDDDPAMLRFVQLALDSFLDPGDAGETPIDYLIAASGEQAWDLLAGRPVDLVFLDLDLPGISGWDFLDQLKSSPLHGQIPVMILSALDRPKGLRPQALHSFEVLVNRVLDWPEIGKLIRAVMDVLPPYDRRGRPPKA